MATAAELITAINNANSLGTTNLTSKGITVPSGSTTHDLMGLIANIETGGGGGVDGLNIHFGSTAPEDTSKLWVDSSEPDTLSVTTDVYAAKNISVLPTTLPYQIPCMASGKVGNDVYLFGGYAVSVNLKLNTILKFDSLTNTLTTLPTTLPKVMWNMGCGTVGADIYLFGGYSSSVLNTILKFDTQTNTITTLSTTLPQAIYSMGSGVVETNVYLFGDSSYSSSILKFDTLTSTITTLSVTLPQGAMSMGSSTVGKSVYLFGGYNSQGKINTIIKFNSQWNTVTTLNAKLPSPTWYISCGTVGTDIYLFGGLASGSLNTILKFDTITGLLTILSSVLSIATYDMTVSAVGTSLYLFGGDSCNLIQKFSVDIDLLQNACLIVSGSDDNVFKLINTDSITVDTGVYSVYIGNSSNLAEKKTAKLYNETNSIWNEI